MEIEVCEVHLGLVTRRRLEPYDRLGRRTRTHLPDILLDLGIAALVARSPQLAVDALRAQLGKRFQARMDNPAVRVELTRRRRALLVAHRLVVQIPVQLPRFDPVMDRTAAEPKLHGKRRLR